MERDNARLTLKNDVDVGIHQGVETRLTQLLINMCSNSSSKDMITLRGCYEKEILRMSKDVATLRSSCLYMRTALARHAQEIQDKL